MKSKLLLLLLVFQPFFISPVLAEEVVEVGGMSIIGNRELPKSLYIVPWKDSEVGYETDFSRSLLNEGLKPVDQDEFARQLDYYELSQQND